jgi:hypothetical protein
MVKGVGAHGPKVFVGCIARDFATGADDEAGAGLTMAVLDGEGDGIGITVTENGDGVDVAEEDLMGAHAVSGLVEWGEGIEVDDFAAEAGEALEAEAGVAADVEADEGAEGVEAVDEFFFEGPDEFLVDAGTDEGSGGVADADEIDAGVDLSFGEAEFHLDDEFEEVSDEGGIVEEIEHEGIDAAEVGCFGAGTFDPAFDDFVVGDALAQEGNGFDAVVHPAAAERVWDIQSGEAIFIREQCVVLVHGWGLVFEEFDFGAAIGGFACGVGHGVDVIEVELVGDAELAFGEDAVIGAVVLVAGADEIGGEHHGDGHEREAIDGSAFEVGEDAVTAVHDETDRRAAW